MIEDKGVILSVGQELRFRKRTAEGPAESPELGQVRVELRQPSAQERLNLAARRVNQLPDFLQREPECLRLFHEPQTFDGFVAEQTKSTHAPLRCGKEPQPFVVTQRVGREPDRIGKFADAQRGCRCGVCMRCPIHKLIMHPGVDSRVKGKNGTRVAAMLGHGVQSRRAVLEDHPFQHHRGHLNWVVSPSYVPTSDLVDSG